MASRRPPKKPTKKPAKKPEEPSPLSPYLGPLLLRVRKAAGMKQEVVAKKAGTSDTTLRKIEHGLIPVETPKLESICKALGANSDALLLEACIALCSALLEKLGRNPELPLEDLFEERRAALRARQEAERRELETDLKLLGLSYLQTMFVNRD